MNRILLLLSLITVSLSVLTAQNYRVGDLYTAPDGSKGIVFFLHPDGTGGWVVALDDACTGCAWGSTYNDVPEVSNQTSQAAYGQLLLTEPDGYNNTQILRENLGANTSYAACVMDFENGWYLPSPSQITVLYGQLAFISDGLLQAGGTLLAEDWYWCTAEESGNRAWALDFGRSYNSGRFYYLQKENLYHVRAVRSFNNDKSTYLWSTGDTTVLVDVAPEQTTTYTVTVTTANGCTDTASHTVVVKSAAPQTFYDMVCQGEPYTGNGFTLTEAETSTSGVVTRTRTVELDGCSTTYTLELTVTPPVQTSITHSACENYEWNGETYTESGNYTVHYTALNGCDSMVTLHLMLTGTPDVTLITTSDTICSGDELTLQTEVTIPTPGLAPQILPVSIGDILCTDNSIVKPSEWPVAGKSAMGVVFYVDNTGEHGWAMHLQNQGTSVSWSPSNQYADVPGLTNYATARGAMTDLDGYNNTLNIRNAGSATKYPAAYAVDFENGWYLPTAAQLRLLFSELLPINASLAVVGEAQFPLDSSFYYWSSTENNESRVWNVRHDGDMYNSSKYQTYRVRSVRNF